MENGHYCAGCNTNWSTLPEADGEVDEQYEYCPICRTDEHLEEGRPGECFIFNAITGEKIDNHTGLAVEAAICPVPEVDLKEADGKACKAYLKAYHAGGHEAAEKAYYRTLRSAR